MRLACAMLALGIGNGAVFPLVPQRCSTACARKSLAALRRLPLARRHPTLTLAVALIVSLAVNLWLLYLLSRAQLAPGAPARSRYAERSHD